MASRMNLKLTKNQTMIVKAYMEENDIDIVDVTNYLIGFLETELNNAIIKNGPISSGGIGSKFTGEFKE